jgi:hypothetical protein
MKKRRKRSAPSQRRKIEGIYDSKLEKSLHTYWKDKFEHEMIPQFKFHPTREWQFDFAFPEVFIAIEIQGFGTGHTSYEGMKRDYDKHNAAMSVGWGIIYLMSRDLLPLNISKTCCYIQSILEHRKKNGAFLSAVREMMDEHPIPKSSTRRINNSIQAGRELLSRTDQTTLPPRDNQILPTRRRFDK